MSSTRYAPEGSPLSQNRYMSSPEYAELRGISGSAVLAKASLFSLRRKRSLLFFLQALSLKPGGLKKAVVNVLDLFPERIGTPTMHKIGTGPGSVYSGETRDRIMMELGHGRSVNGYWDDILDQFASKSTPQRFQNEDEESHDRSTGHFVQLCRNMAMENLPMFIIDLCINPKLEFSVPGLAGIDDFDREETQEQYPELRAHDFRTAEVSYFKDIVGTLFRYQAHYAKTVPNDCVMTGIAQSVFETLDYGLETGKMVILEGSSRIGKTTAAEAWAERHLGEVRFVSLSGLTNRTSLFRALSRVLGLASTYTLKASAMQARVEDFLQRSGLALIIDEAHYLWPQSERIYTRPELIDWVNTALCNHGVPVALISTPQFAHRKRQVERQTGWTAEQFTGRIKRYQRLPETPSKSDLEAVARKLLPGADKNSIQYIVGYALVSKRYMPAVCDVIDDARLIAKKAGRERVDFADVEKAVNCFRVPSDTAMAGAFGEPKRGTRTKAPGRAVSGPMQTRLKPLAEDLPVPGSGRLKEDLAGEPPANTPEEIPSENRLRRVELLEA